MILHVHMYIIHVHVMYVQFVLSSVLYMYLISEFADDIQLLNDEITAKQKSLFEV